MVKNCCVLGCSSNTKRNPAISFFRFPTDPNLAAMWLQLIGRPDFKPSQYSVICQLHFTREDFTSGSHHYPITGIGGQRKRLKTKAIPTQNLNGCTNPELLAEIQMRAKNTIPQKPSKALLSATNTMVNSTLQKNSETAQLQQLLSSLVPALFGNTANSTNDISVQSSATEINNSSQNNAVSTLASILSSQQQNGSLTNLTASSQGPVISIPSNLHSVNGGTIVQAAKQNVGPTLLSNATLLPVASTGSVQIPSPNHGETVMATSVLKSEPMDTGDNYKTSSNGSPISNGVTHNTENNKSTTADDLYSELQKSLLELKNNMLNESHNSTPTRDTNQPTDNNYGNQAYIIDVDTYQKIMESMSSKSEKSIQTEKDLTIFSLESENKALKEQLSQYELAFNSLINWTEGSLKSDSLPTADQGAQKIIESKLID